MRVEFVRSGGLAGIRLTAIFDTQNMPEQDAAMLEKLLKDADFFNLSASAFPLPKGADRFQYQVTVSSEEGEHTLVVSESSLEETGPLRALLDFLNALARRRAARA